MVQKDQLKIEKYTFNLEQKDERGIGTRSTKLVVQEEARVQWCEGEEMNHMTQYF